MKKGGTRCKISNQ